MNVRAIMVDRDVTSLDIADRKIMCRPTLYDKCRNPCKFTIGELRRLDTVLHFTDEELLEIVRGKKKK